MAQPVRNIMEQRLERHGHAIRREEKIRITHREERAKDGYYRKNGEMTTENRMDACQQYMISS